MKLLSGIIALLMMLGIPAYGQDVYIVEDEDALIESEAETGTREMASEPDPLAPGVGRLEAQQPQQERMRDFVRVMPVAGTAGFQSREGADLDNLGDGFAAGLLFDIGPSYFSFETGLLNVQIDQLDQDPTGLGDFGYWSIPAVARWNFSGNPNSTVYAKAGAHAITQDDDVFDEIDLMGVAGIGGAIPLGSEQVALILDASYNQLLTRESFGTELSGYILTAGLSVSL